MYISLIAILTVSEGEQPPSSMIPVIVESKSGGLLVIGGSGGSMITSAVAMVTPLNSVCVPVFLLSHLLALRASPLSFSL